MININFFHKANPDGAALLERIRLNFPSVTAQEIQINQDTYLSINLKGLNTSFQRVINSPQAHANSMNRPITKKMLNLNGLSLRRPSRESIVRYFDILIFDMRVISIKQTILTLGKQRVFYSKESACLQAAETAKYALYHVGLDWGMVRVVLTSHRQCLVSNINPSPHVRSKDLDRLMQRLKKLQDQNQDLLDENQVKMGADPEFMLFHAQSGRMVAASNFFPRHGRVGYDNLRAHFRGHPIAEIRPRPSTSPLTLAENVKAALISAAKMAPYRNIKWVAGSQPTRGLAIGGHIHFSKVKLNFALLRALDNYLAIPIFLIENPYSAVRRRRRYGTLGNFRYKSYGGFEYRTLGSWLISPQITRAVLCLAKIVASHYLELNENYFAQADAQRAFYRGNQEYFRSIFSELWSDICRTASYPAYSQELEMIYTMINNRERWDEKQDLRKTWDMTSRFNRTFHPRIAP